MTRHRSIESSRGLSLLELVIAMALFALVAVMGVQTLNATVRGKTLLESRDDGDSALAVALVLLRSDLDRAAPLLFYPPEGAPQSAVQALPEGFALSVSNRSGEGDPGLIPAPFGRVEWRLDAREKQLLRRSWPVIAPARAGQATPWRPVLTEVSAFRLDVLMPELGWVPVESAGLHAGSLARNGATDGDGSLRLVANVQSDGLPLAAEVHLTRDGTGALRVLESLP